MSGHCRLPFFKVVPRRDNLKVELAMQATHQRVFQGHDVVHVHLNAAVFADDRSSVVVAEDFFCVGPWWEATPLPGNVHHVVVRLPACSFARTCPSIVLSSPFRVLVAPLTCPGYCFNFLERGPLCDEIFVLVGLFERI